MILKIFLMKKQKANIINDQMSSNKKFLMK